MEAFSVGSIVKEGSAVARAFRWDQPFRMLASALALAALAGARTSRLALEQVAEALSSLEADAGAALVLDLDTWVRERSGGGVASVLVLGAIVSGVAAAGRGRHLGWGRAASTAVLGIVGATYVWGTSTGALIAAAATFTVVVARLRWAADDPGLPGAGEWAARCLIELLVAVVLLPVAVVAWLLGGERSDGAVRPEPATPTGAAA